MPQLLHPRCVLFTAKSVFFYTELEHHQGNIKAQTERLRVVGVSIFQSSVPLQLNRATAYALLEWKTAEERSQSSLHCPSQPFNP